MKIFIFCLLIFGMPFVNPAYGANPNFSLPLSCVDSACTNVSITTNPGQGLHSDAANGYAYDLIGSDSILAVGDGTVRCADDSSAVQTGNYKCDKSGLGGLCVIIYHPSINLDSEYCHLASASVNQGDPVTKGQPIGIMGDTGTESQGKHLHFSLLTPGTLASRDSSQVLDFKSLNGYNPNPSPGIISPNPVTELKLGEIGTLVSDFYTKALAIGGTLALLIIVYGGVRYILSFGNPSQQTDAKEWIRAAIFGLALLLVAYIILNTINPCFVGRGTGCG